jgi:hypothetical protein
MRRFKVIRMRQCGGANLRGKESGQRVQFWHFGRPKLNRLSWRRIDAEHTHQMRSYGLYVYAACGQEVLFATLRGCEEYDHADLPLRPRRLR